MSATQRLVAQCPATELTRGTLSHNKVDARCRISGMLRDAEGSPCCGIYAECPIWKVEKERIWAYGRHNSTEGGPMINAGSGDWV